MDFRTGEIMTAFLNANARLSAVVLAASLGLGAAFPALAQTAGTRGSTDTSGATNATDPVTPTPPSHPTKAQRKQARVEKDAQLKKLEDAGYQPAGDDLHYPENIQSAQKKAGIGGAASQ
jgi:hypothetical protein